MHCVLQACVTLVACKHMFKCNVGDVPSDTPAGTVAMIKTMRSVSRSINTSIVKQSSDREFRFAHEGVRYISPSDDLPGLVIPGDTIAVAFTVGTLYVHAPLCVCPVHHNNNNCAKTVYVQVQKPNGEEFLDVHLGEIVQITFGWHKQGSKAREIVLDCALIHNPHLQFTMRWYVGVLKDPESDSLELLRDPVTGNKLYTLPLKCTEGYNWAIHNSSTKDGMVLTAVSCTRVVGTPHWALDTACELEANEIAIVSMRAPSGEAYACVGDGKAMTTTTGGLSDIGKTLYGEQDDDTKETVQRAKAARAKYEKAAATRKLNKKLQQEQQAILAEKEMEQQKQGRLDRDSRVRRASGNNKVKI